MPTGPTVANGQASISQAGNVLTVRNSSGAIINWQGFSIGAGETARFLQPSASSAVLNRVIGQDPSQILGQLSSNGRVFLINPNGIVFGQGAQINVGGLVASTLNLSDQDFLAGKLRFTGGNGAGGIENQGLLQAAKGGAIYLVAPTVENRGIIRAPSGDILLAAGESVRVADVRTPDLWVEITAGKGEALNLGQLLAGAGNIGMFAGRISQSGVISANTASRDAQGRIVLRAVDQVELTAGSRTEAAGVRGGSVQVQATAGDALVSGQVSADGSAAKGGNVQILGQRVALLDGARVSADGQTGGGQILVGGDFRGENPAIQNSRLTFVGADAHLSANALAKGDGGKVVVWADDTTRFFGSLAAKGGLRGGNGGQAEVSGKSFLSMRGTADLAAPRGKSGQLLLDPDMIEIVGGTGDDTTDGTNTFSGSSPGVIFFGGAGSSRIYQSELEGIGGNVILEAASGIKTSGTFTGNLVTIGGNLTMKTQNYSIAGNTNDGIDLTSGGTNPDLKFKATGNILLVTGYGGDQAAPIKTGYLETGVGSSISIQSSGAIYTNGLRTATGDINLSAANGDIIQGTGLSNDISLGGAAPGILTLYAPGHAVSLMNSNNYITQVGNVTSGSFSLYDRVVSVTQATGTSLNTGLFSLSMGGEGFATFINSGNAFTSFSAYLEGMNGVQVFSSSALSLGSAGITGGGNSSVDIRTSQSFNAQGYGINLKANDNVTLRATGNLTAGPIQAGTISLISGDGATSGIITLKGDLKALQTGMSPDAQAISVSAQYSGGEIVNEANLSTVSGGITLIANGNINVNNLVPKRTITADGIVTVDAGGSITRTAGSAGADITSTSASVVLTAQGGIDIGGTAIGGENIDITWSSGDYILNTLYTLGTVNLVVDSGKIVNGAAAGVTNIKASSISLSAYGDIGMDTDGITPVPILTQTSQLHAESTTGSVWIINQGPTNLFGANKAATTFALESTGAGAGIFSGTGSGINAQHLALKSAGSINVSNATASSFSGAAGGSLYLSSNSTAPMEIMANSWTGAAALSAGGITTSGGSEAIKINHGGLLTLKGAVSAPNSGDVYFSAPEIAWGTADLSMNATGNSAGELNFHTDKLSFGPMGGTATGFGWLGFESYTNNREIAVHNGANLPTCVTSNICLGLNLADIKRHTGSGIQGLRIGTNNSTGSVSGNINFYTALDSSTLAASITDLALLTGGTIAQNGNNLEVDRLGIVANGPISLVTSVNTVAAKVGGSFTLQNTKALTVGTVGDTTSVDGFVAGVTADGVNITTQGNLTILGGGATTAATIGGGINAGSGPLTLMALGTGSINSNGGLNTQGGNVLLKAGGDIANNPSGIRSGGGQVSLEAGGSIATALIDAGTGSVSLKAGGNITDLDGAATNIHGASLTLNLGGDAALDSAVGNLQILGGHNITLSNAGKLNLAGANLTGDLTLDNQGAVTVGATIAADNISIRSHSPLTIDGTIQAQRNILLEAGSSAATGDDLVINGTVLSLLGNISAIAGDNYRQSGSLTTQGGSILATAGGLFSMTPTAQMKTAGGPIQIAAVGDISLGLIDAAPGNVDISSKSGNIGSADPSISPNILAGSLKLAAATGIKLTYDAKALSVSSGSGYVTLVNSRTGTVISNDPALQPPPVEGGGSLGQSIDQSVNAANAVINSMTNNLTLSDPTGGNGRTGGTSDDQNRDQRDRKSGSSNRGDSRSGDKDGSQKMKVCNP
jgi:filamentous hemagglutinin family protein